MQTATKHARGFRDRDFIRTKEGFFFCVVGPYHPRDRIIAYVKYVPAKSGKWKDTSTHYKRMMHAYTIPSLLKTFTLLKTKHPQYLFYSEFYNITMTAVPLNAIRQHYKPEEKLTQILRSRQRDTLQEKLVALTSFLSEKSGIATIHFGVTGSILLDIHNPRFSDIDLTVYGLENSHALKKTLSKLYTEPNSSVNRFKGSTLSDWCKKKTQHFPLSPEDAERVYARKWNIGLFNSVPFSIHPTKLEEELTEEYGDKTFSPQGQATIRAVVADDSESLFLPCVYKVRDVEMMEGRRECGDISEVVSYESLYDSLAENGEKIIAKGKLERILDNRNDNVYYRLLVGSPEGKGEEYIKPTK
jgi:predicted nucleotidyltransferase